LVFTANTKFKKAIMKKTLLLIGTIEILLACVAETRAERYRVPLSGYMNKHGTVSIAQVDRGPLVNATATQIANVLRDLQNEPQMLTELLELFVTTGHLNLSPAQRLSFTANYNQALMAVREGIVQWPIQAYDDNGTIFVTTHGPVTGILTIMFQQPSTEGLRLAGIHQTVLSPFPTLLLWPLEREDIVPNPDSPSASKLSEIRAFRYKDGGR
jgi:hypothetical protein